MMLRTRCALASWALAILLGIGGLIPATAQEVPPTSAPTSAEPVEDEADGPDLATLVAPIALYPDLLLALVLQASTQPLQVIQAARFLEKRTRDPALVPDPGWDPAVLGLLNYPALVEAMGEYLDWTEALGDAVVDDLTGIQAATQDIRQSAYAMGALVSNDHQRVIIKDELVLVLPADPKTISIPNYDPEALLASMTTVEEETTKVAEPTAEALAAPADAAPPPPVPAAVAPASGPAPALAAPAPVYAAPPPAISYAPPQTAFWSNAASFAGGAIMGGVLGYALSDDDDDDDWDGWDDFRDHVDEDDWDDLLDRLEDEDRPLRRPGVNIEDSTVIVGGDRYDQEKIQARLRQSREDQIDRPRVELKDGKLQRVGRPQPASQARDRRGAKELRTPKGLAPVAVGAPTRERAGAERARRPTKDIRLPGAQARPQPTALTGDRVRTA
jgi:hypothetical protein